MTADPGITALAQEAFRRQTHGAPAPTLLLGVEFARAAGIPPLPDQPQFLAFTEGSEQSVPLEEWVKQATRVDRAIVAEHLTGTIPVPQFAQEMALLARDGFFEAIVTRSFDALPERALEMTGLFEDEGYQVVDLFDPEWDESPTPLTVVKAYGSHIEPTPPVRSALDRMVIVVGGGGDAALVDALAFPGGQLWWVDQHPPVGRERDAYERARDLQLIVGPAGEPDRFFGEFSLLLQQIPSVNVARMPYRAGEDFALPKSRYGGRESRSVVAAIGSLGGVSPPGNEEFERLLLRTRMQRCQDAIRRLNRRGGGMSIDEQVDRQLEYQLELADRLENELRTLERTKDDMFELLGAIREASAETDDPATTEFLDTLVGRIRDEYTRPQPNQTIVGATLGAVSVLAERMGVSPALVTQLSAYTPTMKRAPL